MRQRLDVLPGTALSSDVWPQDKKALGTKHTIFAPSYAPTPEKREGRSARLESHTMLSAADVRRRLYKKQASSAASGTERPAPQTLTTPRMTERINSGTHLLGLLSNAKITTSHDSFVDGDDGILTSGGARDDIQGQSLLACIVTRCVASSKVLLFQ